MECMNSYSAKEAQQKKKELPILCAQWKKKSFWGFAHGAKHLAKSLMALSSLRYGFVAKNDPKKDIRETTETSLGFDSSSRIRAEKQRHPGGGQS
jgi:hypothetical protein